ncbi:MAG: tRNA epoxyqueuosine(34) reductase QueG [Porphyromonas sp.]|nr:tRNA epoxyqueuosine(34) reductase QueG [Porphyromonas sp.]
MMDLQSTSNSPQQQIRAIAEQLEIDALGFAPLTPVPEQLQAQYEEWLEMGRHAEMGYLEDHKEVRYDPEQLLPGAKSIIVVAVSYYPERLQPSSAPQVAKYAYGRDYHKVLPKLLQQLGDRIATEVAPHQYRTLTDTAPLFERYWAVQSGLGFVGNSRNLIIPRKGTFFFLGEILTTLELESDRKPIRNGCGSCTQCIMNCPTQALSKENGLDARRCISYLSIEHRGDIDPLLSKSFGRRLYGCDTCQDVCPYNRRPLTTRHFSPASSILRLTDQDIEDLTEEQYGKIFFGTAATRAKYEGMKRNAEIYLSNNKQIKP